MFSTAIARSAFRTHLSKHPPSRILPVRVVRRWQRSASQSTPWGLWWKIAADALWGNSGTPGTRCMHPAALRHRRNASDVTALCPGHIIDGAMYSNLCNISWEHTKAVFEDLPGPNRAWLLGVYIVVQRPLLSLYGIIYVTWYTRHLPKPTAVRFR